MRLSPVSRARPFAFSEAPRAVIITVGVATRAGWCSNRTPRSRNSAMTVSLCTRSPRIVSGSCCAVFTASAMASRTPKHMPKCSARMIFMMGVIRRGTAAAAPRHQRLGSPQPRTGRAPPQISSWRICLSLCIAKSETLFVLVRSKDFLLRLVLLDDLFQQIDVVGEGLLAGGRERAGGQRPVVLVGFADRDIAGFLEGAHGRGQVAVGHFQRIAQKMTDGN